MKFYESYREDDRTNVIAQGYDESEVYRKTEDYFYRALGSCEFDIIVVDDEGEEVSCQTVTFDVPLWAIENERTW